MKRTQLLASARMSEPVDDGGLVGCRQQVPLTLGSNRPSAATLALCYCAYMVAAAFGYWIMVNSGISITVWPPNGVILAMLLLQPRKSWPWWIAVGATGELTSNLIWFDNPLIPTLGYVAANAFAVTAAAFLLALFLQMPIRRLTSLTQVLAFLAIGVFVAPVISATIGAAIDASVGKNPFAITWPLWWLGDATGILIATPLSISIVNIWRERARPTAAQCVEALVIALVLVGLSAWELSTGAEHAFVLTLPVLWAALRFEFRGASLTVLGLAAAIIFYARSMDAADVAAATSIQLHAKLQALVIVAASTGLIVAAIIRQHRQAEADLTRANEALEARVLERTRAIEAAEQRFKATFQNAGVGMSIVSGDGTLLRVNDSMARLLGYSVDELEGHSLEQFTHPEDIAEGEAALSRLKSRLAEDYDVEKRYICKDGSVRWGHTTVSCVRHLDGRIAYLIKIVQDVTERKRSEEMRQILAREVHHRSKNLLTIVQVIARQTAARTPQDFVKSFGKRLAALAANQDLLVNSGWQQVDLCKLVSSQLEHFGTVGSRVVISGPPLTVPPSAAQAIGLAMHELATNAAKYGGLSNEAGRVEITWAVEENTFRMTWRETGGPEVVPPAATGFGTTVLDTMTSTSLMGEVSIEYAPEGVIWELNCPFCALQ